MDDFWTHAAEDQPPSTLTLEAAGQTLRLLDAARNPTPIDEIGPFVVLVSPLTLDALPRAPNDIQLRCFGWPCREASLPPDVSAVFLGQRGIAILRGGVLTRVDHALLAELGIAWNSGV